MDEIAIALARQKATILAASVAVFVAFPLSGSCQALFGVRLGETRSNVLRIMGSDADIGFLQAGGRGDEVIWKGQKSVTLCKGKVADVTEVIGNTFSDFTVAVIATERDLGQGEWHPDYTKNSDGVSSAAYVIWPQKYGAKRIGYWELSGKTPSVSVSYLSDQDCLAAR